jgi:hypothetical protein
MMTMTKLVLNLEFMTLDDDSTLQTVSETRLLSLTSRQQIEKQFVNAKWLRAQILIWQFQFSKC